MTLSNSPFPRIELPGGVSIDTPPSEWTEHVTRHRFLMDSWEGGEAYRNAAYGQDARGYPVRNLVRHKREYPLPSDTVESSGDDYELRLARTPVPTLFRDAIETHLSRIYNREVSRPASNPSILREWWDNVDGCGLMVDQWMADVCAPILLTLGQIDLLFDHPAAPAGVEIRNQADVQAYDLTACIVSVILPENLPWWRADAFGKYTEVLVREATEDGVRWRYWNATEWVLYSDAGKRIGGADHAYGQVPIVRLFDRRRPRCKHIGLPRYEPIAELQREFYNRDSELILSDTTQAHPLLQGPEDYIQPDGTVPVGPNWLLPKKKATVGGAPKYEGFDVIEFPKDGAESIRQNKQDLIDAADRLTGLTKPAGTDGAGGSTVAQSGVSKRLDSQKGNDLLGKIARVLEKAEQQIARMAMLVLFEGKPKPADLDKIAVRYPTQFDLMSADEFADALIKFQAALSAAGAAPDTETKLLKEQIRLILPGMEDADYRVIDDELDRVLQDKAKQHEQQVKEAALMASAQRDAITNQPVTTGQADPTSGQAADNAA